VIFRQSIVKKEKDDITAEAMSAVKEDTLICVICLGFNNIFLRNYDTAFHEAVKQFIFFADNFQRVF